MARGERSENHPSRKVSRDAMGTQEEKEQYKKSFMDKYDSIVGPKNLTKEQETKLLTKMIEHRKGMNKKGFGNG